MYTISENCTTNNSLKFFTTDIFSSCLELFLLCMRWEAHAVVEIFLRLPHWPGGGDGRVSGAGRPQEGKRDRQMDSPCWGR